MWYAYDGQGCPVEAAPGLWGLCSMCGQTVVSKCGEIRLWHWAHQDLEDCDTWYEGETAWHRWWKSLVRPEACEVVIGNHRADLVGNRGVVIELQHSSITPAEIRERERFYGDMIWVFNASGFEKHVKLSSQPSLNELMKGYRSFRWLYPRAPLLHVTKPMFWDFGDGSMLRVEKLYRHTSGRCYGWGRFVHREEFIMNYLSEVRKEYRDEATGGAVPRSDKITLDSWRKTGVPYRKG